MTTGRASPARLGVTVKDLNQTLVEALCRWSWADRFTATSIQLTIRNAFKNILATVTLCFNRNVKTNPRSTELGGSSNWAKS